MNKKLTKAMIIQKIKDIRFKHILFAQHEKNLYKKNKERGDWQSAFLHFELKLEHQWIIKSLSNLLDEAGEGDSKAPW